MTESQRDSQSIYRVNKFAVPAEARDEFVGLLERTHAVMRQQDGFVRDLILEQKSGPGVFNLVTLIEFAGPNAVERITAAIADDDKAAGIDRREIATRLGVRSDIGNYKALGF